jgi:hypothetical protein
VKKEGGQKDGRQLLVLSKATADQVYVCTVLICTAVPFTTFYD